MKQYVNWSFRMATKAARKLPPNWSKQGCNMVYQVAYLMKAYNIPPALVVNNDQTYFHLIPRTKEMT
jgi:hypothetical protein